MIAGHFAGAIVNVSSQASKKALKDHTLYCKYPAITFLTADLQHAMYLSKLAPTLLESQI